MKNKGSKGEEVASPNRKLPQRGSCYKAEVTNRLVAFVQIYFYNGGPSLLNEAWLCFQTKFPIRVIMFTVFSYRTDPLPR